MWSSKEIQALIQYIGLYWDGAASNGWPNTKDEQFWECCANAIAEATDLPKRSGKSVQRVPFTFELLLIWRNVKDGSLQLTLQKQPPPSTPLNKKGKLYKLYMKLPDDLKHLTS